MKASITKSWWKHHERQDSCLAWWAVSACVLLLLSVNQCQGDIKVERVQRELQARYYFLKGDYLPPWPACSCNSAPAPAFPKDDFYGDLDKDRAKGVEVAKDLFLKFYATYRFDGDGNLPTTIYSKFVATSDGELAPSDTILNYEPTDFPHTGFPDSDSITEANFQAVINVMYDYVKRLNFVQFGATQIGVDDSHEFRDGKLGTANSTVSCQDAKDAANQNWTTNTSWNGSPSLTEIGMQEFTSDPGNSSSSWAAHITAVRGRIYCDLRTYNGRPLKGKGKLFLKLAPREQGVSNNPPTGQADGKFRKDTDEPEGGIEWKSRPLANSQPDFTAGCGEGPPKDGRHTGWTIADDGQVVIFKPDFNVRIDEADCDGCTQACPIGSVTTKVGSAYVRISLGANNFGKSAGYLYLQEDSPSDEMYTPARLHIASVNYSGYTIPPTGDTIYTDNAKVEISVIDSKSYKVEFRLRDAQETLICTVTNKALNGDINQMQVTEARVGQTSPTVSLFTYTPASGQWELSRVGAPGKQRKTSTWNQNVRTDTLLVLDANDAVVQQTTEVHTVFPWGTELTARTLGSGAAQKTTQWVYYDDPVADGDNYRQLQSTTGPDGKWERYTYDAAGRPTRIVSQFKGNAITTSDTENRVAEITYNGAEVLTVEYLLNHEIGRTYEVHSVSAYGFEEIQTIQCQLANAEIDTPGNLTNIVWRATPGSGLATPGDTLRERHPDGTMSLYAYTYPSDQKKTVIKTGVTNGVQAGIPGQDEVEVDDGIETTTTVGLWGETVERLVKDIASDTTTAHDSYTYTDDLRRSYTLTHHLDGSTESMVYGCCSVDTASDREGVTTQYYYDGWKRQMAVVRLGITTANILDAAGNVLNTVRTSSGSSPTTIILSGAAYDTGGQLIRETNGLNGITTYVEGSSGGFRTRTTTAPNNGQRIETFYPDGSVKSVTGTAVFPVYYGYGADANGAYTIQTNGNPTGSEWVKTYTDMVGRAYKTVYPDGAYSQSFYNNKGQLWKQRDPDGVITLYKYNPKGEQEFVVQALSAAARGLTSYADLESSWNTIVSASGVDRVTQTVNTVLGALENDRGVDIRRTEQYVWKDNSSTGAHLSRTDVSTVGDHTWSSVWKDASTEVTTDSLTQIDVQNPNHTRTVTTTAPDDSQTVTVYTNGLLESVTRKDNTTSHAQVTKTSYGYDAHGRQGTVIDSRNGTTTIGFNNADLLTSVTTPNPGTPGGTPQTTTTYYDKSLLATNVVQPDNTSVANRYDVTGLLTNTSGSRTYPVAYTYDYAGRMKTMKTWTNYSSGNAATTTWNYNPYRGWLDSKDYPEADGNPPTTIGTTGPTYEYTPGGRLSKRTWRRTGTGGQRLVTNYKYGFNDAASNNEYGELTEVSYDYDPQSTPAITYTYDRQGRQTTIVQSGGTTINRSYNDASELLTENFAGGPLNGLTVTSGYDNYLRRNSLSLTQPSTINITYGYSSAGWLQTVTSGDYSATYSYLANSPLVENITFKQNGATQMTTTKQHDFLNRLRKIETRDSQAATLKSFAYAYNPANQRTAVTNADNSRWVYDYDSLGQVKSGKKYWSDGTPVAGQQFEYAFDDIGNRKTNKFGGDSHGENLRRAVYSANSLNQYTSRDVPEYVNVMGEAANTATVSVNGTLASRHGGYFRAELNVINSAGPVWLGITNTAVMPNGAGSYVVATNVGSLFVPKTPENFSHDLDGNLTEDGRWTYTWDAENRLTKVESRSDAPSLSRRKVVWEYDGLGRRIRQTTHDLSNGDVVTEDLKFVSDGWRHIAELNAADNALVRSYVWGLDLSGTETGAGGVGGLLMLKSAANGTHFCAYDGNGNVAALVKATDGTVSANYEYGPFGEAVRVTGPLANENPFRFSTKRHNDPTDIDLYEHRPLRDGRWLSRDPLGEGGGINIYGFVLNSPTGNVDPLGLDHNTPSCSLIFGDLAYSSEGRAYRDPDIFVNFPYVVGGSAIWYSRESGNRSDPSAYYSQTAFGLRGGLCNSCTPNPSSFVKAYGVNRGCCCVRVAFTCSAAFVGIKYGGAIIPTTGRPIPANATVVGHLLGQAVTSADTRQLNLSTSFVTSISVFSKSVSLEKNMPSNKAVPLYELSAPIAFQVGSGGGFSEFMSASCSASIVGPCK